jgi:hypothetical protein
MAEDDFIPDLTDDHYLLAPYELTINGAAKRLYDGLYWQDQATEADIEQALINAIDSGELRPKRGSLQRHPWAVPEPILAAEDVEDWAESAGLDLESNGAWTSYVWDETELREALDDRLRALRAMGLTKIPPEPHIDDDQSNDNPPEPHIDDDQSNDNPPEPHIDDDQRNDKMIALMEENFRLRRALAEQTASDHSEPPPKARNTLYRIIAALMDLPRIDPEAEYTVIHKDINNRLELFGVRPIAKADTVAEVVKAARALIDEERREPD